MRAVVFGERLAPPPDEGIKKVALGLARALRALGHDTLTLTSGGADWPEERVRNFPADRLLRSPALCDAIAQHNPQLVVYIPSASLTLASGARARTLRRYAGGAPVALFATQGRRHSPLARIAARFVAPSVCVVQSRATFEQARALGWAALSAPPAVDAQTFRPAAPDEKGRLRAAFGLPADAFVALHAGHLNRRRGVADLCALASVALPVLVASTSTPHDAALEAELRAAGVTVIAKYLPDIADVYRAADVYLFPVPPDPYAPSSIDAPLSVLEALSCGLPVIARRFGMLPELWPDTPGVWFYDDASELPAALARVRGQTASTRPLVAAFTWEAVAQRLTEAAR